MANFWKRGGMDNRAVRVAAIAALLAVSLGLQYAEHRLSARFDHISASFEETQREFDGTKDPTSIVLLYDAMLADLDELRRVRRLINWTFAAIAFVDLSMVAIPAYGLFKVRKRNGCQ